MELSNNKRSEELGFVPSAVSESAGGTNLSGSNMCATKKCNDEGFKFFAIAAMLVEDEGKPHTINLCRNCYNSGWQKETNSNVTGAGWKTMIEQKVSRGETKSCGQDNGWMRQDVSPYKEVLELLQVSGGMRLGGTLIRQAIGARKAGCWSELVKRVRLNAWDE